MVLEEGAEVNAGKAIVGEEVAEKEEEDDEVSRTVLSGVR